MPKYQVGQHLINQSGWEAKIIAVTTQNYVVSYIQDGFLLVEEHLVWVVMVDEYWKLAPKQYFINFYQNIRSGKVSANCIVEKQFSDKQIREVSHATMVHVKTLDVSDIVNAAIEAWK